MHIPAKIPKLIRFLGKGLVFRIPTREKVVYLTFDDGPIENLTPWILEQLSKFNAKATFFMVGENVIKNPEIVLQILKAGHAIGNHTQTHINGFSSKTGTYISNVEKCKLQLDKYLTAESPKLFRPPYGRIFPQQAFRLRRMGYKIIMWDILSKDYDQNCSPQNCIDNVQNNIQNGSIIVFHDNVKAERNIKAALPVVLAQLTSKGYTFKVLS